MSLESKKPTSLDKEIGARIRSRRKALNMTLANLGLSAGISHQQVVKYEKGDNRAYPAALVAFARSLDVPISYFFGEARDELAEDEPVFRFVTTPEGIELNSAFANVVDAGKRLMILDIVEDLADLHSRLGAASPAQAENYAGM
ncbi:helix-turn-helix domain-containing protein [Rhizobium panacihumi]|uniref:helix-turn-helix domain-containing protein n=1 Tax=Rhizobium panacihumi TaxID=2008450 RepID=UPI003D78E229